MRNSVMVQTRGLIKGKYIHSSTEEIKQYTMEEQMICNIHRLAVQEFSWTEIHRWNHLKISDVEAYGGAKMKKQETSKNFNERWNAVASFVLV